MTIEFTAKLDGLFNGVMHPIAQKYHLSKSNTRLIIKGNQGGGTFVAMKDAAMRVLGVHPDPAKNVLTKPLRLVSKVLLNLEG